MERLPDCPRCGGEMNRQTFAFIKCNDKECYESTFGIRHNEPRIVRGAGNLLRKVKNE